ncbi:Zn(2)-C6 fungal-type domain-containing protein [Trichoderma simmonsii]|uniref:Zn(2)-C6 fungal-type domain-containing protein n=2 Tax=Trichoderma simmonsii TaxID=1491479 RepID=A0A8G0LJL9_9HYPO|nr:Zn(2)-C6 fungal-type domain-containing protein [Trichoderma simmonsii]
MYEPAPPRPKKTNIYRSRTGCKVCRQRRKKCDERKPCDLCTKLGVSCEQIFPTFEFRSVLGPSRSRNAGVRQGTSQRQPDRPSDKPVTVKWTPPERVRFSSSRIEGGDDTTFSPDVLLNEGTTPETDLSLSYALDVYNGNRKILSGSRPLEESSHLESADGMFVGLTPSCLLQQRTNDAVKFYMDAWEVHCLPALNLSFEFMATRGHSSLITDTMATLAANRLSRKLPQRRLFNSSGSPWFSFRPDPGHECLSGELYGSALRKMLRWSSEEFDSYPMLAFVALVLFCYVESSMGNFKEFNTHSQGVEKLLKKSANLVFPHGAGLLAAWVEVKMQNWWRRAYFGVPEFFQAYTDPLLDSKLQLILNTDSSRTATILWILCESHRLNTAARIACWARQPNNGPTKRTSTSFMDDTAPTSEHTMLLSEIVALMDMYSEKLDMWRASFPDWIEPTGNPNCPKCLDLRSPENEAIYFPSHKLAMNMAYYVATRVMHCSGPLQSFATASIHNIGNIYEETEGWIFILLRIAAGISWEECISLNAYTIGFAGLLLSCALCSRRLETGLWIQEWLENRLEPGRFEEGNFPVFQILDAVRLINRERRNGVDVVSLFQTVDDGGGRGKFGSYSSQRIWSMLVYGRCRSTGELISYYVSTRGLVDTIGEIEM